MTGYVLVGFGFQLFLFTWQCSAVARFLTCQAQPLLSLVVVFDCFPSKAFAGVSDFTLYVTFPAIQNMYYQTMTLAVRKEEN